MRRAIPTAAVLSLLACAAAGGPAPAAGAPKEGARSAVGPPRFGETPSGPFRMSPVLPASASAVHCTFEVRGLAIGTRVSVVWGRGGRELARTEHVTERNTRTLSSELVSDEPLGSGTYDVDVLVEGRTASTTSFRIAGGDQADPGPRPPGRPRVVSLCLAASACEPEGPARPAEPVRLALGVATIHLGLEYEDVRPGQTLEVRWLRTDSPRAPLAVTRYQPEGGGELSASFTDTGLLRPGAHHVAVLLDGREVARARFVIEE